MKIKNFYFYIIGGVAGVMLLSIIFGAVGAVAALYLRTVFPEFVPGFFQREKQETRVVEKETIKYAPQTSQEEKIIQVVKESSPSVVSVAATKDVPVIEGFFVRGVQRQQVSAGTGFVVSSDGFVITNKHVVSDTAADYTIITTEGKKIPAQVLGRDPVEDLAVLKVEGLDLPPLKLGDSNALEPGQSVIAIGNALGEFENTISVGVVSGLRRTITASSGLGETETLREIIQTDAAVNQGNSGGPLLNLSGEVIGINVAMARQAENIGFAIPINRAKSDIEEVRETGKLSFPFLGVRYVIITPRIAERNNLPVDYGALVLRGDDSTALAVVPGSAADKAGIEENDIILQINGVKINQEQTLAELLLRYRPGNTITLKILHEGEEKTSEVTLGERP